MKTSLFILPFLALIIGSIGSAVGSAFQQISWVSYASWGIAVAIVGLWVSLDYQGFVRVFTRKGSKYGASSGLTVVLGLAVITGIGFLSSKPRFNKSYDATKSQQNTLSEQTVKILEGMKEKSQEITVTAFFQDEEQKQKFVDLLANYSRVADVLKVTHVNPQADPMTARSAKITSANTVIFATASQESRITQFTEEKITNALLKVLKDRAKKIYFTKGHGEPQLREKNEVGFDIVVQELEGNRYDVAELSLLETTEVPKDADMIAIAGPKYDFTPGEVSQLESYLKNGGALLFAADAMNVLPHLQNLMAKCGVQVNDDLLILRPDDPRAQLIGQDMTIVDNFEATSPVTKDFVGNRRIALLVPNSRSISTAESSLGLTATIVGKASSAMIRVKNVRSSNDLKNIGNDRIETGEFGVFAVANGKPSSAASSDKKEDESKTKETRVVVAGSSQFASNLGAQKPANRDMFMNVTNYLMQDEDFISIRPRDNAKGTLDISSAMSQVQLLLIAWIYPFLFLGGGMLYWFRRRSA